MLCEPVIQGLTIAKSVVGLFKSLRGQSDRKAATARLQQEAQEWKALRQTILQASKDFGTQLDLWDSALPLVLQAEDAVDRIEALLQVMPQSGQNAALRKACIPYIVNLDVACATLQAQFTSPLGQAFPSNERRYLTGQIASLKQATESFFNELGVAVRDPSYVDYRDCFDLQLSALKVPLGILKFWATSVFTPETRPPVP